MAIQDPSVPNTQLLQEKTGNPAIDSIVQANNAAINIVNRTASQARGALVAGKQEGLGYLQDYLKQSSETLAPQITANNSSLNQLFGLLGIPSPTQQHEYDKGQAKLPELQNDLQSAKSEVDKWTNILKSTGWSESDFMKAPQYAAAKQKLDSLNAEITNIQSTKAPQVESGGVLKNLENTPGYQFRLQQGLKAVQNSAAAKGYLNSPRTMNEIDQFAQGLAQQSYNDAVSQAQAAFNSTSGAVQQKANNEIQTGTNSANIAVTTGQNLASNLVNQGENIANSYIGAGTGISQIYSQMQQKAAALQLASAAGNAYQAGFNGGKQ